MERIKMLREQKGMSQAKLAVLADMNPVTLWRYETGQRSPTVDQLERLAEILEVEVGDFFPKDQAPLPLEETAHHTMYEDAIAVTAGKWLEDLDSLDKSSHDRIQALGIAKAALDLANPLFKRYEPGDGEDGNEEAYKRFQELDPRDQHEVVRLHSLLMDVANKAHEFAGTFVDDKGEVQK